MRQYTITELSPEQLEAVEKKLSETGFTASIEHLYWIPVPEDMLTPIQKEHATACGPHVMALETGKDNVSLELLVRARNKIRCDCITYASDALAVRMMHWLDDFLASCGITA